MVLIHKLSDCRQIELEENAYNRTKGMSVDEVIVRLKDRMTMHKTEFRNAFNQLDYKRKGKITRKDFKAVCSLHAFQQTHPVQLVICFCA